jgi:hypothetical protein
MKTKLLLVALFVAMTTTGFECFNDPIIVSIDLTPFSKCYDINPGPNPSYNGIATIDPNTLMDESYRDKVVDARVYDITVQVGGTFSGSVTVGQVFINDFLLLSYSGTWAEFSTPQSLLGGSTHVTPQSAGVQELIRVLKQKPIPPVTLRSSGTLVGVGVPPVPAGLSVCVNVYAQADGDIKN